jgi:hypothetical protein
MYIRHITFKITFRSLATMLTHCRYDQGCKDFPKMQEPHQNSRREKENMKNVTYCHRVSTKLQLTNISILETDDNYALKYNRGRPRICATPTAPRTTVMFMQIHYELKTSPTTEMT